jgi:hypothetical protein
LHVTDSIDTGDEIWCEDHSKVVSIHEVFVRIPQDFVKEFWWKSELSGSNRRTHTYEEQCLEDLEHSQAVPQLSALEYT